MRTIFALLAAAVFSSSAMAVSLEEDVANHVKIFNGDKSLHGAAADTFQWIGLSDTRLFDIIEQRLLADYVAGSFDKKEASRLARYVRALGYSGQSKYEPTLKKFVEDSSYRRVAKAALEDLPVYQKWNPVIANRSAFDPKYSDDVNRVMNMLRADDLLLKSIGAKRIYFDVKDDYLLDFLEGQVKANYLRTEPEYSDAIAWLVKALSSSKKEKYKALIVEVAQNAKDRAIARHAQSGLKKYYTATNNAPILPNQYSAAN